MNLEPVEILLVEDSDEDAELTMRAFRKLRLANHVFRVRDGAEAMDWFFGDHPHGFAAHSSVKLVLLDLKLPKVNGTEVLRAIKAHEKTHTLPVVMLTSSKEDRDLVEAYSLGVNSYIVKPVDFEKFIECIQQLGVYWLVLNTSISRVG